MAEKLYTEFPDGEYDPTEIFLVADPSTGALSKINLPTASTIGAVPSDGFTGTLALEGPFSWEVEENSVVWNSDKIQFETDAASLILTPTEMVLKAGGYDDSDIFGVYCGVGEDDTAIYCLPTETAINQLLPVLLNVSSNYANDTAARAAGILIGHLYHTNGTVKIQYTQT